MHTSEICEYPIYTKLTTEIVILDWTVKEWFFLCVIIYDKSTNEFRLVCNVCTNKSITEKYFTIPINIAESTLTIHTIRNGHHNLYTGERFVNTPFGTTFFGVRKSSFKLTINTLYLFRVYIKTLTNRCFTEWFFHQNW